MKAKKILPWSSILLLMSVGSAEAATFDVNVAVGPGSVIGQIVTDGVLGPANVLDWNLIANDGSTSVNLLGPLSGANSTYGGDVPLSETASQLLFDFSAPAFHFNRFCLGSLITCPNGWAYVSFGAGTGGHRVATGQLLIETGGLSGQGIIGQLAPVPLPATLWMLAPALGGLGFLRRRPA